MKTRIGVLGFQGDYQKHIDLLSSMAREVHSVRRASELNGIGGLIIPGGESTTIGLLLQRFGLLEAIREAWRNGLNIMGTCAGAILLSREIVSSDQPRIGILDATIERNAYGRQIDSFEAEVEVPRFGKPDVRGVFIRAPRFVAVGSSVEVIARFEDAPVIVQTKNVLALTFHPELTADRRIHEYFLALCDESS